MFCSVLFQGSDQIDGKQAPVRIKGTLIRAVDPDSKFIKEQCSDTVFLVARTKMACRSWQHVQGSCRQLAMTRAEAARQAMMPAVQSQSTSMARLTPFPSASGQRCVAQSAAMMYLHSACDVLYTPQALYTHALLLCAASVLC